MNSYEDYDIEHLFSYGVEPLFAMLFIMIILLATGRLFIVLPSFIFTAIHNKRKRYLIETIILTILIISVTLIILACKQTASDYWQEPVFYILLDSFFGLTSVPIVISYVYVFTLPLHQFIDTSGLKK